MTQYDIFISYKRIGASKAVAYRIYSALKNKGYKVFYDREEMFAGKFNEQLYNNIDHANDIIIILEQGSLKACYDKINQGSYKSDYFCREIMHALKQQDKLRIIPILLDGYKMPTDLPREFDGLSETQAIDYDSGNDFESTVYDDYLLGRKFLTSQPSTKKNNGIADFLFYTNANCDIWERGESILQLNSSDNEDHPQCYSVSRSGEHRFTCRNYDTGETIRLAETIEPNAQKYIGLEWKLTDNVWCLDLDDIERQQDNDILYLWGKTLFEGNIMHPRNIHRSLQCFNVLISRQNAQGAQFVINNYNNTFIDSDFINSESFEWFEKAEELGEANASTGIGYCYANGLAGKEKNIDIAIEYYKKAIDKGDADACRLLYCLYGENTEDSQHIKLLYKAAELGDSYSLHKIGWDKFNEANYDDAFRYWDKSVDVGNMDSICPLAYCYLNGLGTEVDQYKAFELYNQCPDDPVAQCWIGCFYEDGAVVDQNLEEAFVWYKKSADQENERGLYRLGRMYRHGMAVNVDYLKARDLFEKSIEQNNMEARIDLGWMYARGLGVAPNHNRAIELFDIVVNDEATDSFIKAECFHGIGYCRFLMQQYQDSVAAYKKAIELGSEMIYDELGRCYELGLGVEKDEMKAVELYEKGVEKKTIEAQFYLASCYERGVGVAQDKENAIMLYNDVSENENTCEANIHLKQEAINAIERLKKM